MAEATKEQPELSAEQQLARGVFPLAKETADPEGDAQAKKDREVFAALQKQRAQPKQKDIGEEKAEEQPKEAEGEKPDAPEAKDEPKVDPVAKAKETLKRVKVRDDVMEGMSDDDLTAWADEVAADIAKRDDDHRKLKERLKALEAKETPEEGVESKDGPVQSPSDDPAALKEIVDPFQKLFADEFGDDLGKQAGEALTKIAEQLQSRFDAKIQALEGQVGGVVGEAQQRQEVEAREALAEVYPSVQDDDEAWDSVTAKAKVLAKVAHEEGSPYEDIPSLLSDAARVLGLEQVDAKPKAKSKSRAEVAKERDEAQPTSPGNKQNASVKSLPAEEKERLLFLGLQKHRGLDKQRRIELARREAGLG